MMRSFRIKSVWLLKRLTFPLVNLMSRIHRNYLLSPWVSIIIHFNKARVNHKKLLVHLIIAVLFLISTRTKIISGIVLRLLYLCFIRRSNSTKMNKTYLKKKMTMLISSSKSINTFTKNTRLWIQKNRRRIC